VTLHLAMSNSNRSKRPEKPESAYGQHDFRLVIRPSSRMRPEIWPCAIHQDDEALLPRQMLKRTAGAVFPMIVPASVFGASAPSNRITVAMVGMGRQARYGSVGGRTRLKEHRELCQIPLTSVNSGFPASSVRTAGGRPSILLVQF